MSKAWDDMRKAKEDDYFAKKNREALERIAKNKATETPRLSPVSGKPLKQEVFMGVTIDRCEQSGGIWLDAGELEQLLNHAQELSESDTDSNMLSNFFKGLIGSK